MDAIPAFAGTDIAQKTDAGIYTTLPSGQNSVLPHAVSSITVCSGCTVDGIPGGDAINFYYDGNGNLNCETTASQCDTSAINRLSWTSFNRPSSIVHEGATTIGYSGACPPARRGRDRGNPEHPPSPRLRRTGNRIEMNAPGSLTKYLSDPASGVMTQHMGPTVTPYVDRDYIMADGHMVAIIVTQNSSTTSIYYPILDHLGSVAVIVDGNATLPNGNANPNYGDAIDRYSYDAWGEARDPGQWTPRTCSDGPEPPFVRGFTGQEQLPAGVCLTNFNARIYNPAIGRFFSADPTVEAPYNPQDLNRYSYVLNDPTLFTDPSGLCFLGCFWQQSWFAPLVDVALVFVGLPWLDVATGIIGSASVGTSLFSAFDAESFGLMVANAGLAGGISGFVATGKIGGALISAGSAAAFAGLLPGWGQGIGTALGGGQVANAAGYLVAGGMIGGLSSVANGQNFASGFLSGGVGSLAGPLSGNAPSLQGAVVASVLGGFASVLGGGKFANGALTAAFAYATKSIAQDPDSDPVRTSPGGTTYHYIGFLTPAQLSVIDEIVDFGAANTYSDELIVAAVDQAFYESSLGEIESNPSNPNVVGLFQYSQSTWAQYHSDLDITVDADQIIAMYEDLSRWEPTYDYDVESGYLSFDYTFEDYAETMHHAGENSTAWYRYTQDYDGKTGTLGFGMGN